jgi:hypothetical protein
MRRCCLRYASRKIGRAVRELFSAPVARFSLPALCFAASGPVHATMRREEPISLCNPRITQRRPECLFLHARAPAVPKDPAPAALLYGHHASHMGIMRPSHASCIPSDPFCSFLEPAVLQLEMLMQNFIRHPTLDGILAFPVTNLTYHVRQTGRGGRAVIAGKPLESNRNFCSLSPSPLPSSCTAHAGA